MYGYNQSTFGHFVMRIEEECSQYRMYLIDFRPPWYGGEQHWCQQSDLAPRTGRGRPVDE